VVLLIRPRVDDNVSFLSRYAEDNRASSHVVYIYICDTLARLSDLSRVHITMSYPTNYSFTTLQMERWMFIVKRLGVVHFYLLIVTSFQAGILVP